MYMHLPYSTLILPLTREVFAGREQRPIIGRVCVCTRGFGSQDAVYLGCYLKPDDGEGAFYSHPTLFDPPFDERFDSVSVGIEGDALVMRACDVHGTEVGTTQLRAAAPVVITHVSIDALLDFAERFTAQDSRCSNADCTNTDALRLRHCVLLLSQNRAVVVCGRCADEGYGKKDTLFTDDGKIIVDGRLLPVGAPVTLFASL